MKQYQNNLGVLFGLTVMIMAVSFFGILATAKEKVEELPSDSSISSTTEETVVPLPEPEVEEEVVDVPDTINGLFIGFDRTGLLTDVLMVGHIDPLENKVKIVSIPRDLEVYFTDEEFNHIKKNNPKNQILHCKINEIYSYIGRDEQALQDVKSVAEIITGLEIDYMMTIDIGGFKDMVDIVGGVEFDVPRRMYYTDPAQDLYIDLQKGIQTLDGDRAEQLVRFRKNNDGTGYERGDLQRIEMQQAFLAAFIDKVTKTRDFNQIKELAQKGYDLVKTDFGLIVILEYAEFFFDLDLEHILSSKNMITIPSYGEKVDGHWFQYFELDKANEAVRELIDGKEETEAVENTNTNK